VAIDEHRPPRGETRQIKVEDAALPARHKIQRSSAGFIERLVEVDVDGIEPMTSVTPQRAFPPQTSSPTAGQSANRRAHQCRCP
jgi:Asp-tRNA(Asn)/Glu-tRNA(Gln) amidotransferase C subunit